MDLETKLTIPPHVISRQVGEEIVVLDLESGLYFGLDEVGKLTWDAISEGKTLGDALAVIVAEYAVDEAQALTDLIAFVGDLRQRGLIATGAAPTDSD